MITRARNAFTLFELILAIGLSVALVSLIGTAIDLYLTRVDKSRLQVEEAQLARTVLAMIADDLRQPRFTNRRTLLPLPSSWRAVLRSMWIPSTSPAAA